MFKNYIKLFSIVAALIAPFAAHGLADAAAPTKIQIPFANGAGGAYVRTVPVASQIGIQNGAASYTDGFPPLNFTPVNAGGVPPFGQDMNGILRDVSAHARWWAAGGPVYYDSAYQTAIGGYPKGAIVQSATVTGKLWYSSVDNNLTNPDTGGAGWAIPLNTVYAPLTGTGASGTWGINITGNAATANSATSATNATNATTATNLSGGTVNATASSGYAVTGAGSSGGGGIRGTVVSSGAFGVLGEGSTSGTGIKGTSGANGTGVLGQIATGIGVSGVSTSSGTGVGGQSVSGTGVLGTSTSANGVTGQSGSGSGVMASSSTGPALTVVPSAQPTTGVSAGSFYITANSGTSVVLHIYDGSTWRSTTLTTTP